jgi:enediyne biosynthesis protein E4
MITPFIFFFAILMISSIRLRGQEFERVLPELSGVRFSNVINESDTFNVFKDFYAYNGGGVAIGDVNNDGLLDLFFTGTHRMERLYLGKGQMRFEDVTERAGLLDSSVGCGALIADLDGDGWRDIYVSRRYKPNSYYHNNGDGTFTDLGPVTGLNLLEPTTHVAPFDYDRDGDLDLYIVTNGEPRREGYINPGYTDRLFRNEGGNVWTDVSVQAGIKDVGYGLSATVGDVNNDGWPDIYVANDFEARDLLYINNRNGTFSDMAMASLQHMTQFSMGSEIADVNNDGRMDIMAVDMLPRTHDRRMTQGGGMSIYGPFFDSTQRIMNTLQLNQGNGRFSDIAYYSGIAATDWSWSILCADFDHDGRNDIYITNGTKRDLTDQDFVYSVSAQKISRDDAYASIPAKRLPNFLFRHDGGLRFVDVTARAGLGDSVVSNGAAYGDLDGDGDLDLVINNTDTVAFIYRNMTMERGGDGQVALRLRLVGTDANRDAIGARVDLYADKGAVHMVREVQPVRGYLSCSSTNVHFGLGAVTLVDSLIVRWPDGQRSTFTNVRPGKAVLTLERTMLQPWTPPTMPQPVYRDVPTSVLPFQHRENFYDDFKRERLLPYRCSQHGPGIATGDVNGDGLVDVLVTGAKYAPSQLQWRIRGDAVRDRSRDRRRGRGRGTGRRRRRQGSRRHHRNGRQRV